MDSMNSLEEKPVLVGVEDTIGALQ
jgi:hypothetical protein